MLLDSSPIHAASNNGSLVLGPPHYLPTNSNPLTGAILACSELQKCFCNDSLKLYSLVLSLLYEGIFRVLRNKMCLGYTRNEIGP